MPGSIPLVVDVGFVGSAMVSSQREGMDGNGSRTNMDPIENWLVAEPTHLKNMSQNGNLPQLGVKIKNL